MFATVLLYSALRMLALLGLVLAATGGSAQPQTSRAADADGLRILVVAPAASDSRVEELYSGLRAVGLSAVELDERAGVDRAGAPAQELGDREQARAYLQQAKVCFRELDLLGMRSANEAVVSEVLRLQRPEESLETLADSLLLQASAALQAGGEGEARAALVLLARLQPSLKQLNPGLYPPSLVQAYAAARIDEESRPSGTLLVHPRVAGFHVAEILIDGVATVTSSTTQPSSAPLPALRQGPHLVTVRAAAAVPFSRIIEVGSEPFVLEPFLGPSQAAALRAALVQQVRAALVDDVRAQALDEVASLSAARAVLYLDAGRAQLLVLGRPLVTLRAAATADGAALGRAALAALQAPARTGESLLSLRSEDDVHPAVFWGGGAVGIVVVAGVVTAALVLFLPAEVRPAPSRPLDFKCCVQF